MTNVIERTIIILLAWVLGACSTTTSLMSVEAKFTETSEQAVVILSTRVAESNMAEPILVFSPFDPVSMQPVDRRSARVRDRFSVGRGAGFASNKDRKDWAHFVLLIQPGLYALTSATLPGSNTRTSYSFGTIAFEAKPGEVLDIGQYSFYFPNLESMGVAEVSERFLTAFFTLGMAGLPDPIITEVRLGRDDDRLSEILRAYKGITVAPTYFEYIKDVTFDVGRGGLMYQVKFEDDPSAMPTSESEEYEPLQTLGEGG